MVCVDKVYQKFVNKGINFRVQIQLCLFFMLNLSHPLYVNVGGGGGISDVVATFNHVGGSFNLLMSTTGVSE